MYILFSQLSIDNEYLIVNLEPFTEYEVEIKTSNKYTRKIFFNDDLFGIGVRLRTSEGGKETELLLWHELLTITCKGYYIVMPNLLHVVW